VATLRAVVFGTRPLADTVRSGDLHVAGDRRTATRFVRCFPRPTPARTLAPKDPTLL
jgi:hypothetical protein